MFHSIVWRGILVWTATFWGAVVWLGAARAGAGEGPAKKTEGEYRSRGAAA